MSTLKKYWPSILTVLVGAVSAETPYVQSVAAAHPAISAIVLTIWGVVLHHLPAPSGGTQ